MRPPGNEKVRWTIQDVHDLVPGLKALQPHIRAKSQEAVDIRCSDAAVKSHDFCGIVRDVRVDRHHQIESPVVPVAIHADETTLGNGE